MPAGRPKSDRQLPHCREVGMSCHECVANSAAGLAAIAESLSPQVARQLFTAMYPEPACLPMGQVFVQILRAECAGTRKAPAAAAYFPAPAYSEPFYRAAVA